MILLVTSADIQANEPDAFQVVRHISTAGHTSCSGPHVRYTKVSVPAANVLCPPGTGAAIVSASFDCSAILVGAMSVGIMRAAFDAALAFAKGDNRRGAVDLLSRQAFADLLSGIKMQTEACRALTWKAAHCLESGPGDYDARRELALSAKIFCSDACTKVVMEAINAVGMYVCSLGEFPLCGPSCVCIFVKKKPKSMLIASIHLSLLVPHTTPTNLSLACSTPLWSFPSSMAATSVFGVGICKNLWRSRPMMLGLLLTVLPLLRLLRTKCLPFTSILQRFSIRTATPRSDAGGEGGWADISARPESGNARYGSEWTYSCSGVSIASV